MTIANLGSEADEVAKRTRGSEPVVRPWGSFIVIGNDYREYFLATYFPTVDRRLLRGDEVFKLLIVATGERLSWQYHRRRSERWYCVRGQGSIYLNDSDEIPSPRSYGQGEMIEIPPHSRHMVHADTSEMIIAEIWIHHGEVPSDEDDIVRVIDWYGRS